LNDLSGKGIGIQNPRPSPNGKYISFVDWSTGVGDLYIQERAGGKLKCLTKRSSAEKSVGDTYGPIWSPDSKHIAYTWENDEADYVDLRIIGLTNSKPRILHRGEYVNTWVGPLDWSPDGKHILAMLFMNENCKFELIPLEGGTPQVLKIFSNIEEGNDPAGGLFSPDGRYIAYLPGEFPRYQRQSGANKGLEIYDLETGEVKRHPNEELLHLRNLCWSPDGEWFVSWSRGPNLAFKANDKTLMTLLANGCRPDISPDGERIVWHGTDWNINIGTLDLDSPQRNITDHKIVVTCEHEYWIYHADWSPDGNFLAFSYAPVDGSEGVSYPAPGSNICICDLRTGKWTQITTDGQHNKEPDWVPVKEMK